MRRDDEPGNGDRLPHFITYEELPVEPVHLLMGLIGGVIGTVAGYYGFQALVKQGLYAIILPGTLMGLGCGLLSRRKSPLLGILCGVLGLAAGIYTEWRFFPFVEDESFQFFLTHIYQKAPMKLILLGLGGLFGFWFGYGREGGVWRRTHPNA